VSRRIASVPSRAPDAIGEEAHALVPGKEGFDTLEQPIFHLALLRESSGAKLTL